MTFIEKFDEIKKVIGKPDTTGIKGDFAAQIDMTDEDCGGTFYIAFIGGLLAIEPYDYHDNTSLITTASADLIDAIEGKTDAVEAVNAQKIKVYGNIENLKAIVSLKKKAVAPKKAEPKKVAEKKPVEKKAALKKAVEKKPAPKKTAEKKVAAAPKKVAPKKAIKK